MNRSVDIAALIFFRILFGILAFAETMALWTYFHWWKDSFNPNKFHFKYYGFQWVEPMSEPFMSIFFMLMLLATVGIILGKHYRLCATFFAVSFIYTFFLEKTHYLNHGYLFCWLSVVMICLPAHRAFSLDVLKKPSIRASEMPYWCLFLLQFLMGVVYFFGGIAKINPDWLNAMPLKLWLAQRADMPILGWLWAQEATAYFMSYGGMLFDLGVVFLLINKKTRWLALALAIFFHTTNLIIFNIGIFPFLSLGLTLLFFPSDFPRKWIAWGGQKWPFTKKLQKKWMQKWEQAKQRKSLDEESSEIICWEFNKTYYPIIKTILIVIGLFHIAMPLRHHYFEGNVAWTEEGHRYSWRMMLRSKQGYGDFEVKNLTTGKYETIRPASYMERVQRRKMYSHPDMILQFAHFLRDEYIAKGEKVEVYANIKVKLNGRKYQPYVDPSVDLAKEEWSFFKSSDWITKNDIYESKKF